MTARPPALTRHAYSESAHQRRRSLLTHLIDCRVYESLRGRDAVPNRIAPISESCATRHTNEAPLRLLQLHDRHQRSEAFYSCIRELTGADGHNDRPSLV